MRAVRGVKEQSQPILMLVQKLIQRWRRMGRRIVQDHNPKDVRGTLKQELKVSLDFLMPFPLMDGIQALTRGVFQTPEEGIPGIVGPGGLHTALTALRHITVAHIRTPMHIGGIEKRELRLLAG